MRPYAGAWVERSSAAWEAEEVWNSGVVPIFYARRVLIPEEAVEAPDCSFSRRRNNLTSKPSKD